MFRYFPHLEHSVGIDPDLTEPERIGSNRLLPGLFPHALPDVEPFDVITMLAVLEHVVPEHQAPSAIQCHAFLVPGGHLLITVPSPAVDHVLEFLRRLRLVHAKTLDQHYGYEVEMTPEIFGAAGLELVRRNSFQLGLNNFFVFREPLAPGNPEGSSVNAQ